jgi:putative CocE/NonD family hydrolase
VPFRGEGPDGYDAVEWIAAQPWCSGRVGTFGGSYGGWYQWALAREKPAHLTTMISTAPGGAWMQELPYHNGCLMLVMLGWLNLTDGRTMQDPTLVTDWPDVFRHLPLRDMDNRLGRRLPLWQEWLDHPTLDAYWRAVRLDDDFAHIDLPVLHITGWYDGDQPGALFFYRGMRADSPRRDDQHLLIGPWDHAGTRLPRQQLGGVDFGPAAVEDILDVYRRWYDRWLKDDTDAWTRSHPVRTFLTGANRWSDYPSWPPPDVQVRTLYLHSDGRANTLAGDGRLDWQPPTTEQPADVYTYDPNDPVPSVIDENFYSPNVTETPLDRRFQHRRDDVLVYTSQPVDEPLTVIGQPTVQLCAVTDGPDTDWFADLHTVAPTGASMLLAQGRLRARFRETLEREILLEPGRLYTYDIELTAVGHVVQSGHRLRLTVTSSSFPSWDRNPNTGHPIGADPELRVARNQVHHSATHPSQLRLPVASADHHA